MRELLLRHEKATDAMIKRLEDGSAEARARTAEILARTAAIQAETAKIRDDTGETRVRTHAIVEEMRAHTREFVAEMRAQREALFRILDRLDGGGASANA